MPKTTHTYVVLELSPSTYLEILYKLHAAGYEHAFHEDAEGGVLINMHGIVIRKEKEEQ